MKYLITFLILISAYALNATEPPLPLPKASLSAQNQTISSILFSEARTSAASTPLPPAPPPIPARIPLLPQQNFDLLMLELNTQKQIEAIEAQTRLMRQMETDAFFRRLLTLPLSK